MIKLEHRYLSNQTAELRHVAGEGDSLGKLVGYAATYNTPSALLRLGPQEFRESIRPGAFDRSLSAGEDIIFRYDHKHIVGRTSSGTLRLSSDQRGLAFELDVPSTTHGNDMLVEIRRKDVTGCSFGFRKPKPGGDRWSREGGQLRRELIDVPLGEVAAVHVPAYPGTQLTLSCYAAWNGEQLETRGRVLAALLGRLIADRVTENHTQSDVVAAMGGASGVDAATVNQILSGETDCPPDRLSGFAKALDVSVAELTAAADRDRNGGGQRSVGGQCQHQETRDGSTAAARVRVMKMVCDQPPAALD